MEIHVVMAKPVDGIQLSRPVLLGMTNSSETVEDLA